jgi:hypothetical protein
MCISNYGKFGQNETGYAGCWWPVGSGPTYIVGAGLWFGTIDSLTADTLVTAGYGAYGGESEPAPGLAGWPINHPAAIIYMYPDDWPPPIDTLPMAPQDTISHQDSWCCFNDSDSVYHMPGGRPIGIECYQTVYAWDLPFLGDVIFFTHEVKNVSGHVLNDCYVGVCLNIELGMNERCAGIVRKCYILSGDTIWVDNIGYMWEEPVAPGTPPQPPGVIGVDMLQTPFDLQWGMDKDGDSIPDQYERDSVYYVNNVPQYLWDADNDGVPDWRDPSQWPQLEMTALKRHIFFPNSDADCYMTMAGYNWQTGIYEPYDTFPSQPGDFGFTISSGPFDLVPDSTATIVFAVMFANWWNIYDQPDTALIEVDNVAQNWYDMYWHLYTGIEEHCEFRISNCEMNILPNPMSDKGTVSFLLPKADHISLKLYNIAGRLVDDLIDSRVNAGRHTVNVNVTDLPQGTYFLVFETPSVRKSRSVTIVR